MGQKLTKRVVDSIAKGEKDIYTWDSECRGFGLKVTPAGKKVFVFQGRVKGRPGLVKITIGNLGDFTTEEARARAEDLRQAFRDGIDPREQAARAAADAAEAERQVSERQGRTFGALARRYFRERLPHRVKGRDDQSLIRRRFMGGAPEGEELTAPKAGTDHPPGVVDWRGRDVGDIRKADVRAALRGIEAAGQPGAAHKSKSVIRAFFGWVADDLEMIEHNPAAGIKLETSEGIGERVLSDAELGEVWQAADLAGYPFGSLVKLLILTGQRRNEVAGMRRDELDLAAGVWSLPGERTKTGMPHLVHLNAAAVKVLSEMPDKGEYLFTTSGKSPVSGFSKAKARLDAIIADARRERAKAAGEDPEKVKAMPAWDLHDPRRTMRTGMAALGIAPHIAEMCVGHQGRGRLERIYNRHSHAPERKAAFDRWGQHVEALAGDAPAASNVVTLRA